MSESLDVLVNLNMELHAPQVLGNDHPVFVQQETHGYAADAIQCRRFAFPTCQIASMPVPVELILLHGALPAFLLAVQRDTGNGKSVRRLELGLAVFLERIDHVGILSAAGAAPAGPKICLSKITERLRAQKV